jgi:hypothetical protein
MTTTHDFPTTLAASAQTARADGVANDAVPTI